MSVMVLYGISMNYSYWLNLENVVVIKLFLLFKYINLEYLAKHVLI